jgi:choline dehydrogenase-like flavoprotein
MHFDAREIESGSQIFGDLCIIGTGPAGLTLALDWNRENSKVILLEGGGFEYESEQQNLFAGEIIGQNYYPIESSRIHAFGGSSFLWGGFCSPLDDIDFKERDWVPNSGWPIGLNDLKPYFKKTAGIYELEHDNFNCDFYLNMDENRESLFSESYYVKDKIWQFSPPTRFGQKYKDAILNSPNIDLFTYARVTEIHMGENSNTVEKVVVRNLAGKRHEVFAKNFVLAAGSIQNARLILASGEVTQPLMGDSYENVGKYFMEHIEINSGELWLKGRNNYEFYERIWKKTKNRAELAIKSDAQKRFQMLNGTISLNPLAKGKTHENFEENLNNKGPDAKSKKNKSIIERIKRKLNKTTLMHNESYFNAFNLYIRMEQAPIAESYVKLIDEKDELGLEKTALNWQLGDLEKHSILTLMNLVGEQAGIEGLGRIRFEEYMTQLTLSSNNEKMIPGCHHMGTTRMSSDPKKGVVDKNCLVHGLSNLYVAGASCFPTSGAANPTFTLSAMSLRLSDFLKKL